MQTPRVSDGSSSVAFHVLRLSVVVWIPQYSHLMTRRSMKRGLISVLSLYMYRLGAKLIVIVHTCPLLRFAHLSFQVSDLSSDQRHWAGRKGGAQ